MKDMEFWLFEYQLQILGKIDGFSFVLSYVGQFQTFV
jgi:hypothetical protein